MNRILKNYFETQKDQQRRNREALRKKLDEAEKFANQIGLEISQVILEKKTSRNINGRNIDIIVKNIARDNSIDKEMKLLRCLAFKDKSMISNIRYKKSRSILDFSQLPGLNKVIKLKKIFDNFFELRPNTLYGTYVNVRQKITIACNLFLKRARRIEPSYNPKKFTIKIACDGTIVATSKVKILNLTFTIINDREKCKTAFGNFILGKFLIYYL